MKGWAKQHLQVFFYTLGQFSRSWLSISMTLLALGIGFSIPLIMYSLVDSVAHLSGQWQERPQITLYLQKSAKKPAIERLQTKLSQDARLAEVRYISADTGLQELSEQYQLGEALALLDGNPLPDVLVVYPLNTQNPDAIAELTGELEQLPLVASAQYDYEWLQKLNALTSFLKRAVILLAGIISVGILLLIANTIRLEIANRQVEIEIIDQLGGTPAFIARPFLYMGLLEGLFGGAVAILISIIVFILLDAPLLRLSELYGFAFNSPSVSVPTAITVLVISSLLGWLAARFTVLRHLIKLAPT